MGKKKITYNFFQKLKSQKVPCSQIPKSVRDLDVFKNLLASEILLLEGNWNRGFVHLKESEREDFENFFRNLFPEDLIQESNRANNIRVFRDSKSRRTESNSVVFLRGVETIEVNAHKVELQSYTEKFGVFSTLLESLVCERLCFVENLESFLNVEKVISENYTFLHTYVRIGRSLLAKLKVKEILVFSDYDFTGLDEYLKFKDRFQNTQFFIPEDFDSLFEKYSRPLTNRNPSARVLRTNDKTVIYVREKIFKTQKFLEQEILIP